MAKKKSGFPVFWVCLLLFVALMVVFWCWVIDNVKKCLVIYEDSQPEYVLETVVADFESGAALDKLTFSGALTRFEADEIYKELFVAGVKGKTFTYEKSNLSYDANKPLYKIYADDELVAKVTLNLVSSESLMFILTAQNWEVESIEPVYVLGDKSVTIVAPDTYSVFINNIKADSREYTGKEWEIEQFKYCKDYATVPKLVEYSASGFINEPVVSIYDNLGNPVSFEMKNNTARVDEFFETEIPEDIKTMVIQNAKDYSNFFSRDIEGCRNSTAPIAGMFPADSYYLTLAENYRLNDMWMYSAHNAPEFANESATEYYVYTPELFSVYVYFEKNMVLTSNGQDRCDIMHTTFYYALIDGEWKIVDMQ